MDGKSLVRRMAEGTAAFATITALAGCASSSATAEPTPRTIYVTPAPSMTPEIIYVTPAPTVGVEPTVNPTVAPYSDVQLKPNESITVTGSALVQGDVIVDGKILYDNIKDTGLMVEIDGGTHTVTAPWGADVQKFGNNVDQDVFTATEGSDLENMKESGCGLPTGCKSVNTVKIGN